MRYLRMASLAIVGLALQAGCRDNSPATPRVIPPEIGRDTFRREVDYPKPLPADDSAAAAVPAPFADEPLMVDLPPEAKAFVEVYRKVGRPRIVVFVNRTLDGQMMPARPPGPDRVTERTRKSTEGVTVDRNNYERTVDAFGDRTRHDRDRFDSRGPAEYTETTTVYLKPGEYDDFQAKGIDYGLMENLLADCMSCDNQVTIVSPLLVHKKLTEQQMKDIQAGRPQALTEMAESLDADILIQVQARPTRQTAEGLELRILAEAMNLRGGESLARGAVDMYPPMDKPTVNRFTRFLSRKLMDGMIQTWTQPPAERAPGTAPAPAPDRTGPAAPEQPAPGVPPAGPVKQPPTTKPSSLPQLPPLPPPVYPVAQ